MKTSSLCNLIFWGSLLVAGLCVGFVIFIDDIIKLLVNPKPTYTITFENTGNITLFESDINYTKDFWEERIVRGMLVEGDTYSNEITILYAFEKVDGLGSNLGSAYISKSIQLDSYRIPTEAVITLDIEDMEKMHYISRRRVLIHEVAHSLGIGSLLASQCIPDCNQGSYNYTCSLALDMYKGFSNDVLTFEDTGSSGTRCSHWDTESMTFNEVPELMTGYLIGGVLQPLSNVSLASLEDLGYVVNYDKAESFNLKFNSKTPFLFNLHEAIHRFD